jgi:hypothetical protein
MTAVAAAVVVEGAERSQRRTTTGRVPHDLGGGVDDVVDVVAARFGIAVPDLPRGGQRRKRRWEKRLPVDVADAARLLYLRPVWDFRASTVVSWWCRWTLDEDACRSERGGVAQRRSTTRGFQRETAFRVADSSAVAVAVVAPVDREVRPSFEIRRRFGNKQS